MVWHTQSRTLNCDAGPYMLKMEDLGVAGAIELVPSSSRFNWASRKSRWPRGVFRAQRILTRKPRLIAVFPLLQITEVDASQIHLPLNALLHPAAGKLATALGCPDVAPGPGMDDGNDICAVGDRNITLPANATMSYVHDPWNLITGHPLLIATYVLCCGIFAFTLVLSVLGLRKLPPFKAQHTPKYCVGFSHAMQNSRGMALKIEVPYAIMQVLVAGTKRCCFYGED